MFQIDVLCICEWMDVLMDVDGFGGIMIISFMISDAVLCKFLGFDLGRFEENVVLLLSLLWFCPMGFT